VAWTSWWSNLRAGLLGRQHSRPQNLPTAGDLDLAHPMGEEPIMPETLETPQKDVQEKPPDECDGVECHCARQNTALLVPCQLCICG
jgi:hypothetical protein